MSMVLEHSRHLEAFLTPDAIRKPSSWAAEEASARPAKGRPPALRAHAMDGELVSDCWKARALPITHAPARLVQHVLPCRCHGGTDRPSRRESGAKSPRVTNSSQVKSNAKRLVSGGSTRRGSEKGRAPYAHFRYDRAPSLPPPFAFALKNIVCFSRCREHNATTDNATCNATTPVVSLWPAYAPGPCPTHGDHNDAARIAHGAPFRTGDHEQLSSRMRFAGNTRGNTRDRSS